MNALADRSGRRDARGGRARASAYDRRRVWHRRSTPACARFISATSPRRARDFERALVAAPDNTLALALLNATAAQTPGALDALIAAEEDPLAADPHGYLTQLRLGFSYLFADRPARDRDADAREAFDAASRSAPGAGAPHVGLGILRENERSANRAKVEFLTALARDPERRLAREYLASIYQVDLKDPQRGLMYAIDVPNVVPRLCRHRFPHRLAAARSAAVRRPRSCTRPAASRSTSARSAKPASTAIRCWPRIYLETKRPADARRVLRASIAANVDVDYAQTLLARVDAGDYGRVAESASR